MVLKLMIMDDECSIVDYTKRLFDKRGYETFGATTGQEAIDLYEEKKPDICILDIILDDPTIDGIEVLAKIREINKDAICIMITQKSDEKNINKANELGAFRYLIKPLSIEDLIKNIEDAAKILEGR